MQRIYFLVFLGRIAQVVARRTPGREIFIGALLTGVLLHTGLAQVPSVLLYEGYLASNGGQPLNGKKDLTFALYTAPTGGTPVWQESHANVQVSGGVIRVVLGRGTDPQPLNVPFDRQYYLGVSIGNDPEMVPRQELMPSAYSLRAKTAEDVPDSSITADKLKRNAVTDDKIASVSWSKITGAGDGVSARVWSRRGNDQTDPATDFLGTTDEQDLSFRTNNLQRMVLHAGGPVDINAQLLTLGSITSRSAASEGAFFLGDSGSGVRRTGGSNNVEMFSSAGNLLLTGNNVGIGTPNPSARFHVAGGSLLGGTLDVTGLSTLNGATVLGNLTTTGDFVVAGDGVFSGLSVSNDATIGHNLTVSNKLSVVGDISGPPESEDNYVAVFENASTGATTNGLAVKLYGQGAVSGDMVNNSNNFVTFINGTTNTIAGRIEGETLGELFPRQALDAVVNGLKLGALFAASPIDPGALIAQIAESGLWYARQVKAQINVGVAFESGNGDYAEWLPRLRENEKLEPGDIVGVTGGKISRTTTGTERMMVVSSHPIVLGNMPEPGKEHVYEKVAFLGQVNVKVIGAVEAGDYIVATGRHDGCAMAVSPKFMTADLLARTVGRAWGSSDVTYRKLVNVAVGLGTGDVAPILQRTEQSLRELRGKLESSGTLLARTQTRLEELESRVSATALTQEEAAQLKAAAKALQEVQHTQRASRALGLQPPSVAVKNRK